MIYLSKGGAGADSDHTWIRPCMKQHISHCYLEAYSLILYRERSQNCYKFEFIASNISSP